MEEHKERFFRSFVKRSKIELEYLVGTIREMEESIRGCYAETIDLTGDRFVKMILMDASFILELFFKFSSRSWTLPKKRPKRVRQHTELLYTATQLHEAGVKFGVLKSKCRFDIKFEKGVGYSNIMALEQTRYIKNAYFADYFALMDSLINTREDVDLLCKKKILVNCIGDHNAAMSMINNLNNGIECLTLREDYIDLYKKLHSFYENPWNKWKATLKRQYFDTPWRAASTVAAIVLLVLTLIQTAFSIFK
ncbi:hypothetical protein RGQ29_002791 [Quercus rubra]|uniref:Uncharacterized protein n=1 Tax=Quercus rubra TaxID=3512 RepID=A0AAN7ID96_QUERU|nr:hypothetical protein RGQ29_002791 [Quercus rubra]